MTFRLTIAAGDAIAAADYPTRGDVHDAFAGAWQRGITLAVIQELEPPEPTTWGTVQEGDEIIAPDNTCWRFERREVLFGKDLVYLVAIDDGQPLTFSVTPDMPIRRRPGVLTAAVQLLHDVGLHGRPA
jgi:hypothetical protein